jgi:hypothetical protein
MSDLVIRDETHYLETVSQIRTLVEQIENVVDAKELADRARAAQVWAKRAKLGNEQVNLASIAKVWAERKAGQLLEVTVTHGGDRRSASRSGNTTLKTLGITKNESSEWQALAQVPDDTFQDAIDGVLQVGNVTTAAVTRMAVHYSSETDQWSTPQDLYDLLDSEFDFDIDVCAIRQRDSSMDGESAHRIAHPRHRGRMSRARSSRHGLVVESRSLGRSQIPKRTPQVRRRHNGSTLP